MTKNAAADAIEKHGILLVYPIENRKEPASLWSVFYPRSRMNWEWDDNGDSRVADLWHLREELSRSRKVVYAKWFRGRATFFSRSVFAAMLTLLRGKKEQLSFRAREILELLELDSPMSTKQIKVATDLRGRVFEREYERAMKELWSRLLIVGFGEIDEGAFPSLAVAATRLIFEELWEEAGRLSQDEALSRLRRKLPADSLFLKQLAKTTDLSSAVHGLLNRG